MRSESVTYAADGLRMAGRFFIDDGRQGKRPGILVFPEAFGLGAHALERAERLAELGYAALACDLHGGAGIHDNLEEAMALIRPLRQAPERIRARAAAGLAALTAQENVDPSRIAAIGFCFGGGMAFELARSGADIRGAVGFHSGLATLAPAGRGNVKGKILALIGADDPSIPPDQRAAFEKEMREAGVDWRLHLYGGVVHSFTDPAADARGLPERLRYDASADNRSWREMLGFFEEIFV